MSSEMRELIRKEVEQWVGITRNRDIERSARVWMEGYDAALTYCADRISALLARTEAGADLRGGNVRFDVRLKNVEAGADGVVAHIHDYGDRVRVVWDKPWGDFPVGTQFYTTPQDASGDAERYRWLKSKLLWADFEPGDYVGLTFALPAGSHVSANLDATLDAAMQAKEAK